MALAQTDMASGLRRNNIARIPGVVFCTGIGGAAHVLRSLEPSQILQVDRLGRHLGLVMAAHAPPGRLSNRHPPDTSGSIPTLCGVVPELIRGRMEKLDVPYTCGSMNKV